MAAPDGGRVSSHARGRLRRRAGSSGNGRRRRRRVVQPHTNRRGRAIHVSLLGLAAWDMYETLQASSVYGIDAKKDFKPGVITINPLTGVYATRGWSLTSRCNMNQPDPFWPELPAWPWTSRTSSTILGSQRSTPEQRTTKRCAGSSPTTSVSRDLAPHVRPAQRQSMRVLGVQVANGGSLRRPGARQRIPASAPRRSRVLRRRQPGRVRSATAAGLVGGAGGRAAHGGDPPGARVRLGPNRCVEGERHDT